jgi:hypothetical protein
MEQTETFYRFLSCLPRLSQILWRKDRGTLPLPSLLVASQNSYGTKRETVYRFPPFFFFPEAPSSFAMLLSSSSSTEGLTYVIRHVIGSRLIQ